jgi:hypothetical protein
VWQSEVVNLAPSDFANGIKAISIAMGKRTGSNIAVRPMVLDTSQGLRFIVISPPVSSVVSNQTLKMLPQLNLAQCLGPMCGC